MLKKFFNFFQYSVVILAVIIFTWFIFTIKDYNKMDKDDLPFFVIQQGKLSKQQIADFTKLSDAKNIWIISDKEDYNKATELIKQSADVISYANQVGRLDLVSMLLAVFAIIFGLAGIIGFLHIKEGVGVKTQDAINENKKQLEQKLIEIEKENKKHFEIYLKEYFKDDGKASKIIERKATDVYDKINIEKEAEDEEELTEDEEELN